MLYLGTSAHEPRVAALLDNHRIGLMCSPFNDAGQYGAGRVRSGWLWAADNGCFNKAWEEARWRTWLDLDWPKSGCLFAVVPDVVAEWEGTLERWWRYSDDVKEAGYPAAFVAQDGQTADRVPWHQLDCLFVGGTTAWKMSAEARSIAREARSRNKWVHVGRVNSWRRYAAWADDADSADGTHIIYEPSEAANRVAAWGERHWANPTLFARNPPPTV